MANNERVVSGVKTRVLHGKDYVEVAEIEHITQVCDCEGRKCRICKNIKCYGMFGPNKRLKIGLRSECYECRRADYHANAETNRQRARDYRKRNAKEIARRDKLSRQANPEKEGVLRRAQYIKHAKSIRAKRVLLRSMYPEKIKEQKRQSANRRREYIRTYHRGYYRRNVLSYLEMSRTNFAKRRARKARSGGHFTKQEWQDLKTQCENKCLCCGQQDVKLTPDHVIPLAKGGSNDISNIQPLCLTCNLRKGTKTMDYRR